MIQRASQASATIAGLVRGAIQTGLEVLAAVEASDTILIDTQPRE